MTFIFLPETIWMFFTSSAAKRYSGKVQIAAEKKFTYVVIVYPNIDTSHSYRKTNSKPIIIIIILLTKFRMKSQQLERQRKRDTECWLL